MMTTGSRKSRLVAGALTTALAVSGAGAYAAASSGTDAGPGEQAASVPPGPERQLRASGLKASEAQPLFSLANGERVGLVSNAATKCLVRSLGSRFAGETCATTAEIAEGHASLVGDECGSTGKNLMEITGLAPEGVLSVRLISSDGTFRTTAIVSGAFKFDGTNPVTGGPYPTGVEWVGSDGSRVGTAGLPVNGDQFCEPTA
ncbi:MAG: hypothetical protein JWN10_44 [Solirubrobacterales bacterium]|nr:hypothetical protein [Solirubrobacterales bacterium]